MLKLTLMAGAVVVGMTGAAAAQAGPTALPLRAGAARIDITPPVSALPPGDSIRDPLYVRAIVVGNGATCAALIGMDQSGVPQAVADDAIPRVARATGCPVHNIIVSGTHTHSGTTAGIGATGLPNAQQVGDAIVAAASQAKAAWKPARIGFGETQVHLNVNRDLFEGGLWYQGANREGVSDKTLAVVHLVGEDGLPIGIYLNYAMHPINFYQSGAVSADFPGEASRYLERRYPNTVAVFTQGPSGDQNPLMTRPANNSTGIRTRMAGGGDMRIAAPDRYKLAAQHPNPIAAQNEAMKTPVPAADMAAYKAAIAETGEYVTAMGAILGEAAIDTMKYLTPETDASGGIWAAQQTITCPGRDRAAPATAFQSVPVSYKDGEDVRIKVGLLRIGAIDFATVNGEVYSGIGMRLKREAPSNRLMMVTIANGRANSGYIYSNDAGSRWTFQVSGSRLKPGCAEDKIVGSVLSMMKEAGR